MRPMRAMEMLTMTRTTPRMTSQQYQVRMLTGLLLVLEPAVCMAAASAA
jgi:hypothetical protein